MYLLHSILSLVLSWMIWKFFLSVSPPGALKRRSLKKCQQILQYLKDGVYCSKNGLTLILVMFHRQTLNLVFLEITIWLFYFRYFSARQNVFNKCFFLNLTLNWSSKGWIQDSYAWFIMDPDSENSYYITLQWK